jgi:hypothetical protein
MTTFQNKAEGVEFWVIRALSKMNIIFSDVTLCSPVFHRHSGKTLKTEVLCYSETSVNFITILQNVTSKRTAFFKPQLFFYLYTRNTAHEKFISNFASLTKFSFFETTRAGELNLNVFYPSLLLHFIIMFMRVKVKGCRKLLEKDLV